MKVALQYGRGDVEVDIPSPNVDVLTPRYLPTLADEADAFRTAIQSPYGSAPLAELIQPDDRVVVVIPDATRALPSDRLLPWLFAALGNPDPTRVTILNGTGTHRGNTQDELNRMVGPEILRRYGVVNHDAFDNDCLVEVGRLSSGQPVLLNQAYVNADKRIILGFIEPHFIAGFSGGYKAIFPGVAGIDSILHYHRAEVIGDPKSTWGLVEGNPTQGLIRKCGRMVEPDFCINVTLNRQHGITGFYCGDTTAAHDAGCEAAKEDAMLPCGSRYPIVITSNSGFPLDQNLYQSVKGMSAAAQIVADQGLIIAVSECADGFPAHGNFTTLLFDHDSPQAILDTVHQPGFHMPDQWQAQILATIQCQADVAIYSTIANSKLQKANLQSISNLGEFVAEAVQARGPDCPVAVLPEGPMTIPYLSL